MASHLLLAFMASASAVPHSDKEAPIGQPTVRASAQAIVRLLEAAAIPMSSESELKARQTLTHVRLAEGKRDAILVEFE